jgi:hypothetical protein
VLRLGVKAGYIAEPYREKVSSTTELSFCGGVCGFVRNLEQMTGRGEVAIPTGFCQWRSEGRLTLLARAAVVAGPRILRGLGHGFAG